ncbi:MAG: hypothetical protein JXM71_01560, partial [Spirochaetales bacterium]|nr:hypothetical protein [Spirochaetales bacterium]
MKRLGLITALALVSTLAVIAQSRQPILRMAPFVGTGVGSSEASMLERLVSSYIVELKVFRVIDDKGQVLALSETEAALGLGAETSVSAPLAADYIVTGTLGKIGDLYV